MPEHLTPAHAHHHPWKTTPDLPHPPSSELLVWGSDSECGILSFLDLCCCFQDTREEGSEGRERKEREKGRGNGRGGGRGRESRDCSPRSSKVSHKSCLLASVSPLNPCVWKSLGSGDNSRWLTECILQEHAKQIIQASAPESLTPSPRDNPQPFPHPVIFNPRLVRVH